MGGQTPQPDIDRQPRRQPAQMKAEFVNQGTKESREMQSTDYYDKLQCRNIETQAYMCIFK